MYNFSLGSPVVVNNNNNYINKYSTTSNHPIFTSDSITNLNDLNENSSSVQVDANPNTCLLICQVISFNQAKIMKYVSSKINMILDFDFYATEGNIILNLIY